MKKRFIAGVRCPQCQALDRIMMLTSPTNEWIECIDCGHQETRPSFPEKIQTSVSTDDEVGIVHFHSH